MQRSSSENHIEDEIDLRELFNTLLEKKVFIFIFTTLITIGAIFFAYSKTPIYEVKSNVQIGFIDKELIVDPNTLIKTANLVFNVEDKISTKEKFVSEVSSIASNKKLKNFIEIKTQAISNNEALEKNKEVVSYIQNKYKSIINQYILNINNNIKAIEVKINNLKNLETKNLKRQIKLLKTQNIVKIDEKINRLKNQDIKNLQRQIKLLKTQNIVKIDEKINRLKNQDIKNLQRQIELLKTQNIVKIDEKIKFYKTIKLASVNKKIKFHTDKLIEYTKAVTQIYQNNKKNTDSTSLTISSLQMVNYQNLILNSQNKVEDLKIEISKISNEIIPNLKREKNNINNVTIKDLQLKIDNINNVSIINLQREKNNIQNDTIRNLEYKLNVSLPDKEVKLNEQIDQLKFSISEQNIQNSKVIGKYIVKENPIKPKKKLIVVVAFVTGLILSIFIVFFLNFIQTREK